MATEGVLSQTLSRGLQVLELLAAAGGALSVDDVAAGLGLHRSIAYRLVRTLEAHRLVERDAAGRYRPGVGLAVLSRSVLPDLRTAAEPVLEAVAADLGVTAFLVVARGEECVTLASVEPRRAGASLAQRPGTVHPLDRGAPGLALLAARPGAAGGPRAGEIAEVRRRGWATSHDEVIPGLRAVAVPVPAHLEEPCALAVVYIDGAALDEGRLGARLAAAAGGLAAAMGRAPGGAPHGEPGAGTRLAPAVRES
ncbi:DNA-binding IclR family transcriptional regulator [Kineococcus xinjiangensis]|uniref:DNA-binding IclR family transcriptional regulator n=1 Tax=Kineococcus xinjiangensis TaxID=512762 RepID=A0A2S6IK44_9ACTN|nr:helix-turn-helix domain-containing protein [Kineococcus xinjiangensis]PPK94579.1 DNA-binding IclR family transcriptional regulator [Kineococcus xinjiangensis]